MSNSASGRLPRATEGNSAPSAKPQAGVVHSSDSYTRRDSLVAQRRTSAGSAVSSHSSHTPSATVQRLYRDPYADAIHWRRNRERTAAEAQARTAAAAAAATDGVVDGEKGVKERDSVSKDSQLRGSRQGKKTVLKAPPLSTSQSSPADTRHSVSPHRQMEDASVNAPRNAVLSPPPPLPASPKANEDEIVCVALPDVPPRMTPRVSAAVNGTRLELRGRGLTALPCLHLSNADTAAAAAPPQNTSDSLAGASPSQTLSSAHGSGDVGATRLHAVNLRQNAIRTLLTPFARTSTNGGALPVAAPRSTPLLCYAHVSSLDLTHNALTSIAGVEALRCLRSLRLAFNVLTSLSPLWASPYVAELDVLDVSSNALTELLTTEDVRALESHHIRVITHATQAFSTTGGQRSTKATTTYKPMRLRVLYASNNQLRVLPSAIYTLSHLADLRLRKNQLSSVPESFPSKACLPLLARLDLSMNALPANVVAAVTARVEGTTADTSEQNCRSTASPPPASDSAKDEKKTARVEEGRGAEATEEGSYTRRRSPSPSAAAPPTFSPAAPARSGSSGIQLEISHNTGNGDVEKTPSNAAQTELKSADASPDDGETEGRQSVRSWYKQRPRLSTKSAPTASPTADEPTTTATTINITNPSTAGPTKPISGTKKAKEARPPQADSKREEITAASGKPGEASVKRPRRSPLQAANGVSAAAAPAAAATATSTPAVEWTYEQAIARLSENVYAVDVALCVATLQQKLEAALTCGLAVADGDEQRVVLSSQDLLCALSDSVGTCVGVTAPANLSTLSGGPAGGAGLTSTGAASVGKSSRLRLAQTARVLAALLQCLPPAGVLCFSEDTQARSPPLLLLTNITPHIVSDQLQRLLYQVLAHHLLQHCLSTPKISPALLSGLSLLQQQQQQQQSVFGAAARADSPPPPLYRRVNSTSPPPMHRDTTAWRGATGTSATAAGGVSAVSNVGGGGGGGGSGPGAARSLTFSTPLQVVHVLSGVGQVSSCTSQQSSMVWAYAAWRQTWETAVARRRLKHHSTYVCEVGKRVLSDADGSDDNTQEGSRRGALWEEEGAASACPSSTKVAEGLYPFACTPAAPRVFEWRRLHELQPSLYSPLPAPWETLFEQLYRNPRGTPCIPPILSSSCERVTTLRDCPISLACLLLCAVELPATSPLGSTSSSVAAAAATTSAAAANSLGSRRGMLPSAHAATAVAAANSGVRPRKPIRASAPVKDIITHALQRRHWAERLALQVEEEVATVAAEQVPPCDMDTYTAAQVQQSQQAALKSYVELIAITHTAKESGCDDGTTTAVRAAVPLDSLETAEELSGVTVPTAVPEIPSAVRTPLSVALDTAEVAVTEAAKCVGDEDGDGGSGKEETNFSPADVESQERGCSVDRHDDDTQRRSGLASQQNDSSTVDEIGERESLTPSEAAEEFA